MSALTDLLEKFAHGLGQRHAALRADLKDEVATLRAEIAALRAEVEGLKKTAGLKLVA